MFEIDGIIVKDAKVIEPPSLSNPKHAFAFKTVVKTEIKEATVDSIFWRETSYGRLTPTVILIGDGVNIAGVNIKRISAHNAKYVQDNSIGPGAVIQVHRGGDVIPHIYKIVSPADSPQFPPIKYSWKGVDIFAEEASDSRSLDGLVKLFKRIGANGLGPGKIKVLYENNHTELKDYIHLDIDTVSKIKGLGVKTATAIKSEVNRAIAECDIVQLMTASGVYGEGFGDRKMRPIMEAFPDLYNQ